MAICTIEEARALLGAEAEGMTDDQIFELRRAFYSAACGLVELYRTRHEPAPVHEGLPPQRRPKRNAADGEGGT